MNRKVERKASRKEKRKGFVTVYQTVMSSVSMLAEAMVIRMEPEKVRSYTREAKGGCFHCDHRDPCRDDRV